MLNKKGKLPSRLAIQRYWIETDVSLTSCDEFELSCFGCGEWFNGRYDGDPEKTPLDRAHIIPKSHGGTNDVSNIVLLCKTCHRDAPMYGTKDDFISWLNSRESISNRDYTGLGLELGKLGITLQDKSTEDFLVENFQELEKFIHSARIGIHFDSLGRTRAPSSIALVIRDFLAAHGKTST